MIAFSLNTRIGKHLRGILADDIDQMNNIPFQTEIISTWAKAAKDSRKPIQEKTKVNILKR